MHDGCAGLPAQRVDLRARTFVDVAAAEGYTANHLFDRGAVDVDACDINERVIERMWKVRA